MVAADRADVRFPPPLLFFAFAGVAGALERWAGLGYPKGPRAARVGAALLVAWLSVYLVLHAVVVLGKRRTAVDYRRSTSVIVEGGPFRFTRNPMYLSLIVLMLALAVLFLSVWFLLATAALWWFLDRIAVQPEERYLERKFGERYLAYKARVRRWA